MSVRGEETEEDAEKSPNLRKEIVIQIQESQSSNWEESQTSTKGDSQRSKSKTACHKQ